LRLVERPARGNILTSSCRKEMEDKEFVKSSEKRSSDGKKNGGLRVRKASGTQANRRAALVRLGEKWAATAYSLGGKMGNARKWISAYTFIGERA